MTLADANIPPRLDDTSQHLANSYHGCQQCRYDINSELTGFRDIYGKNKGKTWRITE